MKVYNEQSDKKISNQLKEILENIRKNRNFDAEEYIEAKKNIFKKICYWVYFKNIWKIKLHKRFP